MCCKLDDVLKLDVLQFELELIATLQSCHASEIRTLPPRCRRAKLCADSGLLPAVSYLTDRYNVHVHG